MAIVTGELLIKFSVTSGAAGNSTAGTASGSLGKYISTTTITDNTLHNVFDVITGDENAASTVDYRGLFVHNSNASLTWTAPVLWFSAEVSSGATAAYWWDSTATSALASASAQMLQIASETTAPTGFSAGTATTKATGSATADIPAGNVKGFWIRRTAANTAALNNDGVTFRIEGDTAA